MYGYSPLAIPTSYEHTKFPSVDERIKQLQKEREEALAAHKLARRRMAERRKNKFTGFELGQLVWLDTRNIKTNYHKKIAPKREGPFKIIEISGQYFLFPHRFRRNPQELTGIPEFWRIPVEWTGIRRNWLKLQ